MSWIYVFLVCGLVNGVNKMLTCSCDFDGGDWYYYTPRDFGLFSQKRRKRCCSCAEFIEIGGQCVEFPRYRSPMSDIEEKIWGDEVGLASWYMCEWCGEMYLNLAELGYCMYLGDSMRENIEEYWDLTGFKHP